MKKAKFQFLCTSAQKHNMLAELLENDIMRGVEQAYSWIKNDGDFFFMEVACPDETTARAVGWRLEDYFDENGINVHIIHDYTEWADERIPPVYPDDLDEIPF